MSTRYLDRNTALICVRLALAPLIRFGLRHSLRVQDLIEQVKVGCIEIATKEIEKMNEDANICRLSAVTGLHRRDVRRIYSRGETKEGSFDLLTRVIGAWQANSKFLTKDKKPKVLSYQGPNNDFQLLMESVATDLTAGTVLFELERIGAVKKLPLGLKLVYRTYNVRHEPEQGFKILSDDIEDMLTAVEENLTIDSSDRNLHAKTVYDNIAIEDLPKVQKWIVKEGAAFHRRARQFLSKLDLDLSPSTKKTPGGRVALGTFSRVFGKKH